MYYGWHSTKVIHEERVKQLSKDAKQKRGNLLMTLWRGMLRLRLWLLSIIQQHKAKRSKRVPMRKPCQTMTNHEAC